MPPTALVPTDNSQQADDSSNMVPIVYQGQTLGWVRPDLAAQTYAQIGQMMAQRGPGQGAPNPGMSTGQMLATAADAAVTIYDFLQISDLDKIYQDCQDARDAQVLAETDLIAAAGSLAGSGDFVKRLRDYLNARENVDMYMSRALDVQLKCLWANALAAGGNTLANLFERGTQAAGDATGWIVGGIAAGGFLLAELFNSRGSRSRNGSSGTRGGRPTRARR